MFSIYLDSKDKGFKTKLDTFLKYEDDLNLEVITTVSKILSDVKKDGDRAVIKYSEEFDRRTFKSVCDFSYTKNEIRQSTKKIGKDVLEAMEFSYERILDFHSEFYIKNQSTHLNEEISRFQKPIEEILIYVPGGKASYPSTVLMATGPAKVAGVKKIYLTSPSIEGNVSHITLAAASIAGVDKVYSLGGAQALAAFAYGTETFPQVQKIIGPGNKYVTEAKRQLFGIVGIDLIAGPSELLIVGDETSNSTTVAFDLMAQAEHDELASSILISSDIRLIEDVKEIIKKEIKNFSRKNIIRKAFNRKGALIKVKSSKEAIEVANKIVPEHIHLVTKDALELARKPIKAGIILVGEDSANGLSDYVLGPSHVLPTGKTARFFSPLSVEDFLVKSSFVNLKSSRKKSTYNELIDKAFILAEAEGLSAHAKSLIKRRK